MQVETTAPETGQVPAGRWEALAARVLESGHGVTRPEALDILGSDDSELSDLLRGALRVRERYFGRVVRVHVLENAKSGACPEDCGFCSQSTRFETEVSRYGTRTVDQLVEAGREAVAKGAVTYCMVTATRGPSRRDIAIVCEAAQRLSREFPGLGICASLGLVTSEEARQLRSAGVTRYNHNLETSPSYFDEVVTTHSFDDRVSTVRSAKEAGLEACCGGIIGLGETPEDRVDLALLLRALDVDSVPVNFLDPRPGTPLAGHTKISAESALRALAMFRFVHPRADLRMAGGREACLGSKQALGLYAASSIFTSGYLTTGGQSASIDRKMIIDEGFEIAELVG